MKKIISRIIVIKEVHSFLFKYSAVILAFGLTTLLVFRAFNRVI